eukprot:gene7696-1375_t
MSCEVVGYDFVGCARQRGETSVDAVPEMCDMSRRLDQAAANMSVWSSDSSRWKHKRDLGSISVSWLKPPPADSPISKRTIWRLGALFEASPERVFRCFTENMADILPLGVGTNPQVYQPAQRQPWLGVSRIVVHHTVTAKMAGGLIAPREFFTAGRSTVRTVQAAVHPSSLGDTCMAEAFWQDSIGLDAKEWDGDKNRTRGINHQVCFAAIPVVAPAQSTGGTTEQDAPLWAQVSYFLQTSSGGWVPDAAVDMAVVDEHMQTTGLSETIVAAHPLELSSLKEMQTFVG